MDRLEITPQNIIESELDGVSAKRVALERPNRFQKFVKEAIIEPKQALAKLITACNTRYVKVMLAEDFARWKLLVTPHFKKAVVSPLTKELAKQSLEHLTSQRLSLYNEPLIPFYRKVGQIQDGRITKLPQFDLYDLTKLSGELLGDPQEKPPIDPVFTALENHHNLLFSNSSQTEVTKENILAAVRYIAGRKDIPWKYIECGCVQKADLAIKALLALGFPKNSLLKVAINLNEFATEESFWRFHTAAAIKIPDGDIFIIDPAFNQNGPMTPDEWVSTSRAGHEFDQKKVNIIQIHKDKTTTTHLIIREGAKHTLYLFHRDHFYNNDPTPLDPDRAGPFTSNTLYILAQNIRVFIDDVYNERII